MLIPELNRLRPISCDPFTRPRAYVGPDALTLGYVSTGTVKFGPYTLKTEKSGEILALAATDLTERNGRLHGRLCFGRAAGLLVDIPSEWAFTTVYDSGNRGSGIVLSTGAPEIIERNVVAELAKHIGSGTSWLGARYRIDAEGPANFIRIGDLTFNQGGIGLTYKEVGIKLPGLIQYRSAVIAEVTAETPDTATFSLFTSANNIHGFNPPVRKIDGVVVPKNGSLPAVTTGWIFSIILNLGEYAIYRWRVQKRTPSAYVQQMQNAPFSVAVRNLSYLDPVVAFPEGIPWWGFIESCARASAFVHRLSWPQGKAVRFSRHIGSTNAVGVREDGEAVTTADFKAEDFLAADWLPVSSEGLEWETRYPLVDITDMQVACTGTAFPFIVPRCEYPVVIVGEGKTRRLEIIAPMPDDEPWQVVTDWLGQTVIRIAGEEGAWRLEIEGTAWGEFWLPNWTTEELERVTLYFDENGIGRFDFE